jgi:predicted GNAT superfamily acetyltransferase
VNDAATEDDVVSEDDIVIRQLESLPELHACVALQRAVWGAQSAEIVPVSLLKTLNRTGGVVAGAFLRRELVGIVVGFTGWHDGAPIHWSDILAVLPELRDRHIGERLKWFQRERLLAAGVRCVQWTFEPLESRNAHLNLVRLGATAAEYAPDFYGQTDSPLHAGIGTDRLVADWRIASDRVAERAVGAQGAAIVGAPPASAAWRELPALLDARVGRAWPEPVAGRAPVGGSGPTRIAIPARIQALKAEAPELARLWRSQTRASFEAGFDLGLSAIDLVRDGEVSHYILGRFPAESPTDAA